MCHQPPVIYELSGLVFCVVTVTVGCVVAWWSMSPHPVATLGFPTVVLYGSTACLFTVRPSVLCGWGRVLLSYPAQRRSTHVSVCADPPRANGVRPVQLSSLAEPCYGVRQPWLVRRPILLLGGRASLLFITGVWWCATAPDGFVGWGRNRGGCAPGGSVVWLLTVPLGAASTASRCGEVCGTAKVGGGRTGSAQFDSTTRTTCWRRCLDGLAEHSRCLGLPRLWRTGRLQ